MKQKIVCQKGKCFETETIETKFDNMFDKTNIVERIQLDLLKNMIR